MQRLFLLLPVLVACRPTAAPASIAITAPSGAVVARVGAVVLTAETIRARIEAQGGSRARYSDPKELRAFVDNQVRFELLANEALRQGLDRDAEVQDAAKRVMVQRLIERRLENPAGIDDAAVAREYERTISDYKQPERAQVTLLKLKTVADANAAWRALASDTPMAELRKKYGVEENRDLELKYWSAEELTSTYGTDVAKAVFGVANIGEVGPIVKSSLGGFIIFKLTGRRAAFHRPLADVAAGIRQKLAQRERNAVFDAYVDGLRGQTDVTVDEAALGKVFGE